MVEKQGSWYSYKGEKLGQGRESAKEFLLSHKDISVKLEQDIYRHFGLLKDVRKEDPKELEANKVKRIAKIAEAHG
jgi:recombination protein RecA